MRVPSGSLNSAKPVTYLWERHKEVARLLVAGERPVDICRRLGYTQAWLSTMMNSPVFKEYVNKLSERKDENAADAKAETLVDNATTFELTYLDKDMKDSTAADPLDAFEIAYVKFKITLTDSRLKLARTATRTVNVRNCYE